MIVRNSFYGIIGRMEDDEFISNENWQQAVKEIETDMTENHKIHILISSTIIDNCYHAFHSFENNIKPRTIFFQNGKLKHPYIVK